VNGVSYLAATVALLLMRRAEFVPKEPTPKRKGQVREGVRVVWADARLRTPILMTLSIGMLAYENQVALPLFAKETFGGDAGSYGILSAAMGVGAAVGGLLIARFGHANHRRLGFAAVFLGVAMLIASAMPTLPLMVVSLFVVGGASVGYITMTSATLQLNTPVELRGRVMALYVTAIIGTTPIGGPIIGWIGQHANARAAYVTGGVTCLLTALVAWPSLRRSAERAEVPEDELEVERLAILTAEEAASDKDSGIPRSLPVGE
jgi:MFS family permease